MILQIFLKIKHKILLKKPKHLKGNIFKPLLGLGNSIKGCHKVSTQLVDQASINTCFSVSGTIILKM